MTADTLLKEAETYAIDQWDSKMDTRTKLDTCLAVNKRHEEREGQYAHDLGNCKEENAKLGDKVKRLRVWAWISKAALAVGAVFAVKELVDTSNP